MSYSFTASMWRWKGDATASWVFVTLPQEVAFAIRCDAPDKAFGSVAVTARIGGTSWQTSLFREKTSGSYVLPVKAAVRKAEGVHDGDTVEVNLIVGGAGNAA